MGIYSSGSIFGIRIYTFNDDDISTILFEQKYDNTMSHTQLREAYLFYMELNDKHNIFFSFYTECSNTLNNETYMGWYPMSLPTFLEKFGYVVRTECE